MLSLVLYGLILSSGSFYLTARHGKTYEEAVPLTIFCSVQIVFIFGLLDNLRLGFWILCLGAFSLYVLGIRHIIKFRRLREFCLRFFSPAFTIYLLLLSVFAIAISGRVAFHGDEFSFWATSVKKMWHLNMLPCVPQANPYFPEYPPGMQILQYILQSLKGSYSEWRIYFAYMSYFFALFLPFLKGLEHKHVIKNLLVCFLIFSSGTILYPDALNNLMVDLVLGATFSYGMAKVFLLRKHNNSWSIFDIANIIMTANMLVLIKSAGKLFAALLLISLIVTLCGRPGKGFFDVFRSNKRRVFLTAISLICPFLTAWLWKVKYSYYPVGVAFDTSSFNLPEFFHIISGKEVGYRSGIMVSFIRFIFEVKIQIGFITLTNMQLVLLLFSLILLLWYLYRNLFPNRNNGVVFIFIIGLFIYWFGLMASYMYTFSEGEGTALASMQRYLNIYSIALLLFTIFLTITYGTMMKQHIRLSCCILVLFITLVSYPDIANLLSRNAVGSSIAARAPFQELANQIEADPISSVEENNTVLLIHKEGYPHVPVNHFTYLLWPNYHVPWECSYGSQPLFEGDTYTKILTSQAFQQRVRDLGVNYIAISRLDDDFINLYGSLFDTPLENGQVYKVPVEYNSFTLLGYDRNLVPFTVENEE